MVAGWDGGYIKERGPGDSVRLRASEWASPLSHQPRFSLQGSVCKPSGLARRITCGPDKNLRAAAQASQNSSIALMSLTILLSVAHYPPMLV